MTVPGPAPPRSIRRRLVRVVRVSAAVSIILAALAVGLVARGESEPRIPMLIAAALGIGLAVLLGTALVTLILVSKGGGHRSFERDE